MNTWRSALLRPGSGNNGMVFRRQLTIALSVLAIAVAAQAAIAWAMLRVADQHVQRGRVASDIHSGFLTLSAVKQRLRTWVAQVQQGAAPDVQTKQALQAQMQQTLTQLLALSRLARTMDDSTAGQVDFEAREELLALLKTHLRELEAAVEQARPLKGDTEAATAWSALTQVFDVTEGRDLRALIAEGITRETQAVQRGRVGADSAMQWMRRLWTLMGGLLALAALAAAWHFTRALRRPLDELSRGAQALQQGQLNHRIPLQGNDEFATVARSVNGMAAELQAHRQREAAQRLDLEALVHARTAELQSALESLRETDVRRRRLLADISHELRTPATVIRGEAQITLRGGDRPTQDYRDALTRIVQSSQQLAVVMDDLLGMAQSNMDALSLERRPTDLQQPLGQAFAQARTLAAQRDVRIQRLPVSAPHGGTMVLADVQRLRQLVSILLDNAVGYSRPGGLVTLSLRPAAAEPDALEVVVQDEGIGIAPEELPHVFERQFRGSAARQHRQDGSGLGLAIAQALATAHGGSLALHSSQQQGTQAVLRLPLLVAVSGE